MLTERERLRRRLDAQLLSGQPAASVDAVVDRLLAVQAQDPRGFRLAVRARTTGLTARDVDTALNTGRVVVGWLNRGTLHLVAAEDYRWLHRLTTPPLHAGTARRLQQEGVSADDADRATVTIRRVLADGPLTRAELAEHVASVGVRTQGQALVHVLFLATIRGLIVRGPMRRGEQAYVLCDDWLPPEDGAHDADRDHALARLAVRYLRGHGPATERDLARWARLPLRDVRVGLRGVGEALVDLGDDHLDLRDRPQAAPFPPPRLLGPWDAVLCGWTNRDDILGEAGRGIVTDNGLFRPFAMVDGRAVAIWRLQRGRVAIDPLFPLDDDVRGALDADARGVEAFFRDEQPGVNSDTSGRTDGKPSPT